MEMSYDRLDAADLRGSMQSDYLVALDARFRLADGGVVICDELGFPVVELARSLFLWLADPEREDFEFDSMSYEEAGALVLRRRTGGWTAESAFAPGGSTSTVGWAEVERCCGELIARVERDLLALGVDPRPVIRR